MAWILFLCFSPGPQSCHLRGDRDLTWLDLVGSPQSLKVLSLEEIKVSFMGP